MIMKIKTTSPRPVIVMAGAVLLLSLSGCRQRTADNMEPSGDTVEVVINPAASEVITPSDTITTIDIKDNEN